MFRRRPAIDAAGASAVESTAPAPSQRGRKGVRPQRVGWFERRRQRRKRRRMFEEIVAWIVVPFILYGLYLAYHAVGGLPPGAMDLVSEVTSLLLRGGRQ